VRCADRPTEAEAVYPAVTTVGRRHVSLREAVVHELRERILHHVFEPGQRLIERELSAELEVSRVPLREAILQLQTEGLVRVLPRRGAFVASFPAKELDDFFALREALEPLAARLAAERAAPDDFQGMRTHLIAEAAALAQGDADALASASSSFHNAIVEAAHSSRLTTVMRPLGTRARWQVDLQRELDQRAIRGEHQRELDLHAIGREHQEIMAAIASHDADAAARLSLEHAATNRMATAEALRAHPNLN
jgi:DNA-binding GntR family transcriptional regulator